jgi:regulator of protease activity HflC (stomatin/prohibitin superfamily)
MKYLKIAMLLPLMFCLQGCLGVTIVDTGHRGIETHFGKVVGESLPEGIYFYNPFTSSIEEMDVRTKKMETDAETYTRDIQQAKIHITVNYNLDKEHANDMYQNVGISWEEKLIPQTVQGTLKSVIGKWDAVDLIGNRGKAQQEIQQTIATILATKGVVVTRVEVSNIDYTKEFESAVEAKVRAIQEAEQAKNKTVQVREEATQTLIKAETEAKSMQIRAQALTQNASLVQWEAVQKWDGVLPVYMLGGGATPFINITPK